MGSGCRTINKYRWGERDESAFVEVAEFFTVICLRGGRAVDGIVGHEGFVVIFPTAVFRQLHDAFVDRLAGRGVVAADVVAHYALVCRAVGSVLVGQSTLVHTNLAGVTGIRQEVGPMNLRRIVRDIHIRPVPNGIVPPLVRGNLAGRDGA